MQKPPEQTTGWRARELWRDGVLVGWVGITYGHYSGNEVGHHAYLAYRAGERPLRRIVDKVSLQEARAALEAEDTKAT